MKEFVKPLEERDAEFEFLAGFGEDCGGQLLGIPDGDDLGDAMLKRNQAIQLDGLARLVDDQAGKRLRKLSRLSDRSAERLFFLKNGAKNKVVDVHFPSSVKKVNPEDFLLHCAMVSNTEPGTCRKLRQLVDFGQTIKVGEAPRHI